MTTTTQSTAQRILSPSIGILIARIAVGLVFFVHGWQKLTVFGHAGVTGMLDGFGVPGAPVAAVVLIGLELVGGVALILGAGTRVLGVAFAVSMTAAMFLAHLGAGFFPDNGGYAYVMLLGLLSVALVFTGPGDVSIDRLVAQRRRA